MIVVIVAALDCVVFSNEMPSNINNGWDTLILLHSVIMLAAALNVQRSLKFHDKKKTRCHRINGKNSYMLMKSYEHSWMVFPQTESKWARKANVINQIDRFLYASSYRKNHSPKRIIIIIHVFICRSSFEDDDSFACSLVAQTKRFSEREIQSIRNKTVSRFVPNTTIF